MLFVDGLHAQINFVFVFGTQPNMSCNNKLNMTWMFSMANINVLYSYQVNSSHSEVVTQ